MNTAHTIRRVALLMTCLLVANVCRAADELDNWSLLYPKPVPANYFFDVMFDGNQFVAVGDLGMVVTSTNGVDWKVPSSVTTSRLFSVGYGDGVYLAGGNHGVYLRSTDAQNWSAHQLPLGNLVNFETYGICFGTNVFLMLGDGIFRSADLGLNWTLASTNIYPEAGVYGDGKFVIVGYGIFTSPDGLNWTQQVPYDGSFVYWDVACGDGRFVAVGATGSQGIIATSPNGIDWYTQIVQAPLNGVTFANGQFTVVGGGFMAEGYSGQSSDGVYFSMSNPGDNGLTSPPQAVVYGNGIYVSVGNGSLATSVDGQTWNQQIQPALGFSSTMVAGKGKIVLGAIHGILATTNGIDFNFSPVSDPPYRLSLLAFDGYRFVTSGQEGPFLVSTNGTDWTQASYDVDGYIWGLAYGNGRFVAGGYVAQSPYPPIIVTSTDGVSWSTTYSSSATNSPSQMCFGNGTFLAVSFGANLLTSIDGINWTPQPRPLGQYVGQVRFIGGRFFALGLPTPGLLMSSNAVDWIQLETHYGRTIQDVAYGDGQYLLITSYGDGTLNTIRTSSDGLYWTDRYKSSLGLLSAIYANHAFYVTGQGSEILRSDFTNIPKFQQIGRTNGEFSLQISGEIGQPYLLQGSSDLTNWTDLTSYTNQVRIENLTVPVQPGANLQFWRAVTP